MNTIMIDYDLMKPGQQYDRIIDYIETYATRAPVLRSTWLIRTSKTAIQVRDELLRVIDANDKLLVTDVSGAAMAWHGLPDDVSAWIKKYVGNTAAYR